MLRIESSSFAMQTEDEVRRFAAKLVIDRNDPRYSYEQAMKDARVWGPVEAGRNSEPVNGLVAAPEPIKGHKLDTGFVSPN